MTHIGTLLHGAAAAVFFIACGNVATLLLSRASGRSRETSVRVALGASRRRLIAGLLSDSALISVTGGALGALFGLWTGGILPALLFEQDAEELVFVPDLAATLVAAGACATVLVACGLVPLFEVRDDDPALVLRRESAGPSKAMQRVRSGLVMAQMTCGSALLISSGLLVGSFTTALRTNEARRLGPSLLTTIESPHRFARPDLGLALFRDAQRAALSAPGVATAALTARLPGDRPAFQDVHVEPPPARFADIVMKRDLFTPELLDRFQMPPVAGRMFGGLDRPSSCRVAVINEPAATALFQGRAVGRSILDAAGQPLEIVGVLREKPADPPHEEPPTIYVHGAQVGDSLAPAGEASFRVPQTSAARGVLATEIVSSTYFPVAGLTPVNGRVFDDEQRPGDCRVGVVNQQTAELYFGGHAVGGAVVDAAGIRTHIVGVVHTPLLRSSQKGEEPTIYLPMAQDFVYRMILVIGVPATDGKHITAVKERLQSHGLGDVTIRTMDEHLGRTALATERIAMLLVSASAATAMGLAIVGLYGAVAEAARQRRREFAVRIALGAPRWRVIRQVVSEGILLAGTGSAAGLLLAMASVRWLSRITPGESSIGVWIWIAAPLAVVAAGAIVSVLPARRAIAGDPLAPMRE